MVRVAETGLREAIQTYLESVDGETLDVDEFVAAAPGVSRAAVAAFIADELGLDRVDPGALVYDRFALFRALRSARAGVGGASPSPAASMTRLAIGAARFVRLACTGCAQTHWRPDGAAATCGFCGAAVQTPGAAREVGWPSGLETGGAAHG